MNNVIQAMLSKHDVKNLQERKNAIKEILQEVILGGLSRAGFFEHAAFYGGTALRIFYGLDRFSENLDFSLVQPNEDFDLESFFPGVQNELASYGFKIDIRKKDKTQESKIQSAFLKGNSREHVLALYPEEPYGDLIPKDEKIKIKFEVDVNPSEFARFERRYRLLPSPYETNIYDEPSLFAGKIHAVLCRGWQNRVKGRDLYDYLFFMSRMSPVNIEHLNARMKQTGHADRDMDLAGLKSALKKRFASIDFSQAREDVAPFIANPSVLEAWSEELFKQATDSLSEI